MEEEQITTPVDFVPSATTQMYLPRRGTGSDANVAKLGFTSYVLEQRDANNLFVVVVFEFCISVLIGLFLFSI